MRTLPSRSSSARLARRLLSPVTPLLLLAACATTSPAAPSVVRAPPRVAERDGGGDCLLGLLGRPIGDPAVTSLLAPLGAPEIAGAPGAQPWDWSDRGFRLTLARDGTIASIVLLAEAPQWHTPPLETDPTAFAGALPLGIQPSDGVGEVAARAAALRAQGITTGYEKLALDGPGWRLAFARRGGKPGDPAAPLPLPSTCVMPHPVAASAAARVGVGIVFGQEEDDGLSRHTECVYEMKEVLPGSPAARAGVTVRPPECDHRYGHDPYLRQVDGRAVAGLPLPKVIALLQGPPGSTVTLDVSEACAYDKPRHFSIVRGALSAESLAARKPSSSTMTVERHRALAMTCGNPFGDGVETVASILATSFEGFGLALDVDPDTCGPRIARILPGSFAARSPLRVGDRLTRVRRLGDDEQDVTHASVAEVLGLLGETGSNGIRVARLPDAVLLSREVFARPASDELAADAAAVAAGQEVAARCRSMPWLGPEELALAQRGAPQLELNTLYFHAWDDEAMVRSRFARLNERRDAEDARLAAARRRLEEARAELRSRDNARIAAASTWETLHPGEYVYVKEWSTPVQRVVSVGEGTFVGADAGGHESTFTKGAQHIHRLVDGDARLCHACQGAGQAGSHFCVRCGGSGKVYRTGSSFTDQVTRLEGGKAGERGSWLYTTTRTRTTPGTWSECPDCAGKGRLGGSTCSACGGLGREVDPTTASAFTYY